MNGRTMAATRSSSKKGENDDRAQSRFSFVPDG
jgi:hypothetical protein